jgi:CBS domain-containing protein
MLPSVQLTAINIMHFQSLPTSRFPAGTCISKAFPGNTAKVSLDSPALSIMTDLVATKAATIHPHTTLKQAEENMIHQGVRLLFVVSEMPCVDGVVTAYDLQGDKPLRLTSQRQVHHADLLVADVMTQLSDLDTIEVSSLSHATVGQVMATFTQTGHLHLLVCEPASVNAPPRIRGLISKTQLQRQLGLPVEGLEIATTFVEVSKALG